MRGRQEKKKMKNFSTHKHQHWYMTMINFKPISLWMCEKKIGAIKKKTYLECTCNPTSMNPRWWWNTMTGRCSMNIFFIQNYSLLLLLLLLLLLKMFEKIWHSKQEKKRSIMDEEIDLDLNIFFLLHFNHNYH